MVYLGLQRQADYPHEKERFPFAQLATDHASRLLTNMIKKKKCDMPQAREIERMS